MHGRAGRSSLGVVAAGTALALYAYLPLYGFFTEGVVQEIDKLLWWLNLGGLVLGFVDIALWLMVGVRLLAGLPFGLRPRRAWILAAVAGACVIAQRLLVSLLPLADLAASELSWGLRFISDAVGLCSSSRLPRAWVAVASAGRSVRAVCGYSSSTRRTERATSGLPIHLLEQRVEVDRRVALLADRRVPVARLGQVRAAAGGAGEDRRGEEGVDVGVIGVSQVGGHRAGVRGAWRGLGVPAPE